MKTAFIILAASTSATLVHYLEKYVYNDWQFLVFLGMAVMLDTLTGYAKALVTRDFASKPMMNFCTKTLVYAAFLLLTHILKAYTVNGVQNVFFSWFDNFAYGALMLRECVSIIENLTAINPKILPPSILKYLRQFEKDGKTLKKDLPS